MRARIDTVRLLAHAAYQRLYSNVPIATSRRLALRLNAGLAVYRARERRGGRVVP